MRQLTFLRYFVLVYVAFSAPAAFSQNSQSYLNDVGGPVYGVTIPVENGFINVSNGNLHLEFPLATHPQRGALNLNEKLVYDSRIWMFSSFGSNGSYHWWPNNVPGTGDSAAGWRFVTGAEMGSVYFTATLKKKMGCMPTDPLPGAKYYNYTYANTYTWVDPSGASHVFDAPWLTQTTECDNLFPRPQSVSGWAADGSGYEISFSGDTVGDPTSITIKNSSGTQLYPQVVDRYGNYWSFDSNGNLVDDTGRTPVIVTHNGNTTYYDVSAPNGTTYATESGLRVRYTVTTALTAAETNFGQSDVYEWYGGYTDPRTGDWWPDVLNPVQSISLPDGSQYTFSYDFSGELSAMTLPTGGVIHYGYNNFVDSSNTANRWLSSRTVGSNPSMTFTPSVVTSCANYSTGCVEQVNVHKPSGDETVYQLTLNNGAWNTGVTAYTGTAASGTPLVQTSNTYNFGIACNPAVCNGSEYITKSLETTLLTATGIESYSQPFYANPATGQLTALKEWDYIPLTSAPSAGLPPTTTPTRETDYAYTGLDVQQVTVLDSSGAQAGQTNYTYTTNATATSGVAQHGTQNAGGPYLKTISHWLNTGSPSITTYTTDDTGDVIGTLDPDQHPATTISYQCANSLPYEGTNALGQVVTYGYDCNSGVITSVQDSNDAAATPARSGTTYSYEATAGRIQTVTYPDAGTTTYVYPSATEVDTTIAASPDPPVTTTNIVDTYGRAYQQIQNGNSTETSYDANGRVSCTANPHVASSSATASTCITSYDGLDRPLIQLQADGTSTLKWSYSGNTTTLGSTTTSTDENGNQMQRTSDAFGHLKSVSETLSGGSSLTSNYIYDGLGNLQKISQLGIGSPDVPRVRTFTYDSLARLLCASNPEVSLVQCPTPATATYTYGTIGYAYDPNGNVSSKTAPAPNSASGSGATVTANYGHDALNRVSWETAPGINYIYQYDQGTRGSLTSSNTIGRLVWATNSVNADVFYSYDPMGRVTYQEGCTPQACVNGANPVSALYDQAGNLYSLTYPDGRTTQQSFDASGHMSNVNYAMWKGTTMNQPYFTATQPGGYDSAGHLVSATLGVSVPYNTGYDNRERLQTLGYGPSTAPLWSKTYGWTPNSNLQSTSDQVTGVQRQFGYDSLNRLTSAQDQPGTNGLNQSYTYDSFGNLLQNGSFNDSYTANNQMFGYAYDAAGNLQWDGINTVMTWDAENRLATAGGATYIYDPIGNRVGKQGVDVIDTVYFGGQPIARNTAGQWTDLIYGPTGLLAEVPGTQTGAPVFRVTDHLGSSVGNLLANGTLVNPVDYTPFGQLFSGSTSDPYEFTGLEHDQESDQEHASARQYSSIVGRWMSPDPYDGSIDIGNPQSFNRYSYVLNNPLGLVDPSGLQGVDPCPSDNCGSSGDDDWLGIFADIGAGVCDIFCFGNGHPAFHGTTQLRPRVRISGGNYDQNPLDLQQSGGIMEGGWPMLVAGGIAASNVCGASASSLDNYLGTKNSPMAGQGTNLMTSGAQYNIDPRLLVSLAGAETGFGTNITAGQFNAFNVLYHGLNSPFASFQLAINSVGHSLTNPRNGYDFTNTSTLYGHYCSGPGCSAGLKNVNTFMNQQGANTSSLHNPCKKE